MSTKNVAGICSFLSAIAIQDKIQKSFCTFWNLHDNGKQNLKIIIIHFKTFENWFGSSVCELNTLIDKLKCWKGC